MSIHSYKIRMAKVIRSKASQRTVVADKREAILRAAIKVFASKGYFNSKVADIASEAGIADGTVYLYFKSKDEILHSIFDRAMAEFIAEGKQELTGVVKLGLAKGFTNTGIVRTVLLHPLLVVTNSLTL